MKQTSFAQAEFAAKKRPPGGSGFWLKWNKWFHGRDFLRCCRGLLKNTAQLLSASLTQIK